MKSFLISLLFIKKYKIRGKIKKTRFNFSLRLKKKFMNTDRKDNNINPNIMFSKKFMFLSLIKNLLNNLPDDSKLMAQKKTN